MTGHRRKMSVTDSDGGISPMIGLQISGRVYPMFLLMFLECLMISIDFSYLPIEVVRGCDIIVKDFMICVEIMIGLQQSNALLIFN